MSGTSVSIGADALRPSVCAVPDDDVPSLDSGRDPPPPESLDAGVELVGRVPTRLRRIRGRLRRRGAPPAPPTLTVAGSEGHCGLRAVCATVARLEAELAEARGRLETLIAGSRATVEHVPLRPAAPSPAGSLGVDTGVRTPPDGPIHGVLPGPVASRPLTAREWQVAVALAGGASPGEVSSQLGIAVATVHKHLEHVYAKLGVHTQVAVCAAVAVLVSEPHPEGADSNAGAPHALPEAGGPTRDFAGTGAEPS